MPAPIFRPKEIIGNHGLKNRFHIHILNLQNLPCIPQQFLFRHAGMPAGCRLRQRIADACTDPFLRGWFKPQRQTDPVRCFKPDSVNVHNQAIRVRFDPGDRRVAIGQLQLSGIMAAYPVFFQKKHKLP